jgi:hypothetical protein
MIWYTCWHHVKVSASRNVVATMPLSFLNWSVSPPEFRELPKSASLTRLMEHWDGPYGTTVCPEDGNQRQFYLCSISGRWRRSQDLSHRVGAIQRSRGHTSLAPWWVLQLEGDWGNQRRGWCFLCYTWCWDGTATSMWTTYDRGHSAIFSVFAWTATTYNQCGWLSPFRECNASTSGGLAQWSSFLCRN